MGQQAIGLDIGYSNLCVVTGDGDGTKELLFPAGVAPLGKGTDFSHGEGHDTEVVVDGREYVALIDQENKSSIPRSLSQNYIYGTAYKALVRAVLLRSKQGAINHLVTGLPVSQYANSKSRTDLIGRLEGLHQLTDDAQALVAWPSKPLQVPKPRWGTWRAPFKPSPWPRPPL